MKTMKAEPKVLRIDVEQLDPHPLNDVVVPLPGKESEEWAAMLASIRLSGVFTPLIVSRHGDRFHVIDGMRRLAAARACAIDELDCIEIDSNDAAIIVVDSMLARKRLTPGAAAYFAIPVLDAFLKAGKARSLANLKIGKSEPKPLIFPNTNPLGIRNKEDLSQRLGVCSETLDQARKVHHFLHDPKAADVAVMLENAGESPKNTKAKQEELRTQIEAELAAGTLHIWDVLRKLGGRISTEGKPKGGGKPIDNLRLQFTGFVNRLVNLKATTGLKAAFETALEDLEDPDDVQRLVEASEEINEVACKRLEAIEAAMRDVKKHITA